MEPALSRFQLWSIVNPLAGAILLVISCTGTGQHSFVLLFKQDFSTTSSSLDPILSAFLDKAGLGRLVCAGACAAEPRRPSLPKLAYIKMVLQNKYKAKASRRHNSSKTSADNAEAGSSKPGYRQRLANKHGQRSASQSKGDEAEDNSDYDEEDEGSVGGSDAEEGNPDFPSLAKAAAASSAATSAPALEDDPSNPSRGKYARRRLGESKLARLERLEAAKDPRLPDDEEPEPEVDISALVARVAALGDSASTQAGVSADIARNRGQHETASDVENDIDHSLSYLHEKERQRQKARGRGGVGDEATSRREPVEAVDIDAEGNKLDFEQMKKDKEKAEAVRVLKARFQGRGVGERSRKDAKPRTAPSIHIGPGTAPASGTATPIHTDETSTLSDNLTAEIESSLEKSRCRTVNGETGSVHSGRSSFSTTFGRRKSPLVGVAPSIDPKRGGGCDLGPDHRTERIDSFFASLNDRSIASGRDPSVFSLSPAAGGSTHAYRMDQAVSHRPIHSTPGELGRLESFLDDMLG